MEYDAKELVCHPRFQPIGEAAFMVSFGDAIHPALRQCPCRGLKGSSLSGTSGSGSILYGSHGLL